MQEAGNLVALCAMMWPGSQRGLCEKRLIVARHGQGHHQTDGQYVPGYGPFLTDLGLLQAKRMSSNPTFARALHESRRPAFVASNMIRAVETMVAAAPPGSPILVQPMVRELNCDPSATQLLELWFQERRISADLRECQRMRQGPRRLTLCASLQQLGEVIDWLGNLDADTIFVASHGGLLSVLDYAAYSPPALLCGVLTCSVGFCRGNMENCEVREYRLIPKNKSSSQWYLRKAPADLQPSTRLLAAPPAVG